MVKAPIREDAELARRVLALHERGFSITAIEHIHGLSRSNVVNLIGYGKRLAAGQPAPLRWDGSAEPI